MSSGKSALLLIGLNSILVFIGFNYKYLRFGKTLKNLFQMQTNQMFLNKTISEIINKLTFCKNKLAFEECRFDGAFRGKNSRKKLQNILKEISTF
ncbi:MAG: hypothetical protein EOO46_09320 [Flavobacterium sp.]|nr:MAG: hypothetical protein EOO46_09320 [Flavobacterium sp.]